MLEFDSVNQRQMQGGGVQNSIYVADGRHISMVLKAAATRRKLLKGRLKSSLDMFDVRPTKGPH